MAFRTDASSQHDGNISNTYPIREAQQTLKRKPFCFQNAFFRDASKQNTGPFGAWLSKHHLLSVMFSHFWRYNVTRNLSNHHFNTGEAEFHNTFWLDSWDHESRKTFGTMMEDVSDILIKTTAAVNQKPVPKSHIETSECHTVSIKKIDISTMSFHVRPFCRLFKKFQRYKTRKRNSTCARGVSTVETKSLDYLMT